MDLFESLARQGAMIERLSSDSRRCAPGTAFFAYPGERADGRAHILDALARGAAAVVWDAGAGFSWRSEWHVPNAGIENLKQRASEFAGAFHGHPSEALWICGVTGTNGKTSSSHWLAALLGRHGARAGVIGTLGQGYPGALSEAGNTTPDAVELQAMLKGFRADGARAVAMEVSSHGLVQGRVSGVRFSCALFTNISHDHLDYHRTMEAYAEAKSRLFGMPGLQAAVLNMDDALGVELARRLAGRVRTIGYSVHGTRPAGVADFLLAKDASHLASSWGDAPLFVNQIGRFNLSNALGVLGAALAYGLPFAEAVKGLASLPPVPGRMQRVADAPLVIIDYAHTPDALENVLGALRPVAAQRGGRLVVVFGAGGDRDPSKRAPMGAVAARLADTVLITSDNPRNEDPERIIQAIAAGIPRAVASDPDRRRAIRQAVRSAAREDVVLIAGKGHEPYQEIAGRRLPFSDDAEARAALRDRSDG